MSRASSLILLAVLPLVACSTPPAVRPVPAPPTTAVTLANDDPILAEADRGGATSVDDSGFVVGMWYESDLDI